jgi:8-oxo-dGTP diphosphatase
MSKATPLPVVCAVIEASGGRVLIAQRPAHKHLGLKWEFPGGKVERDETPEHALLREIEEELGCRLEIIRELPRFTHDYTTVVIEMIPFVCRLAPASPAPHPHEHLAVRWVPSPELAGIDLAPADFPVVASYHTSTTALDSTQARP